jgi:hypothetical protein
MAVYDFDLYAKKRKVIKLTTEIAASATNLNRPNSVRELKCQIFHWFELNREIKKYGTI